MTKKELMQIYYLNREILHDTEELVNFKINTRNYENGVWKKKNEELILKRESELVKKIRRCTALRDKINNFISTIEDSSTRQIFEYRYMKCMSWKQVAYMLGGYMSEDCVRKIAERYIKKISAEKK